MSASSFHRIIVEDVIKNMRADFANEGLDDQVLEELKQAWETKLIQAGVYEFPNAAPVGGYAYEQLTYNYLPDNTHANQANLLPAVGNNAMYMNPYMTTTPAPRTTTNTHMNFMNSMSALRSLNAPSTHTTNTSTTSTNTYGFDSSGKPPPYMAPPASMSGWNTLPTARNTQTLPNIKQNDGANDEPDVAEILKTDRQKIDTIILKKFAKAQQLKENLKQLKEKQKEKENVTIPQLDGLGDRKTEGDDDDDDDDDEDGSAKGGEGDEELGSGDDDESEEEEPDTEHIVLCQYEKVTRVKNKRKANLKDGIMHINGVDFVFSKANGEFDW